MSAPSSFKDTVVVSVLVPTFNHGRFIARCLDGILMQKTDFPYEVLIGEDDSKDGTREICKQYADRHPDRIRLFLNDRKNVVYIGGRATGRWNFRNLLNNARGKYVATCDGDDYWISPDKLQKQVDLLERRPDIAGCFSNSIIIDDNGQMLSDDYFKYHKVEVKAEIRTQDIVPYGISPANTLLYRRDILRDAPRWFTQNVRHSGFDLLITLRGVLFCIDEKLGAYRMHAGGIWSGAPVVTRLMYDLLFTKPMFFDGELALKYNAVLDRNRQYLIESLMAQRIGERRTYRLIRDLFSLIASYPASIRYGWDVVAIASRYCFYHLFVPFVRGILKKGARPFRRS